MKAGIEPNATIGQLVKMGMPIGCGTTNTSDTHKRHTCNQLLANLMPTRTHGIDNVCFFKSEGERSDMIMSVAA